MPPELTDLADHASELLDSQAYIGIPLALIGAVLLSIGTQFQHRGVAKVESSLGASGSGLSAGHLRALLVRPSWVFGTVMLGVAIVFQLTSLWFAPLIVVQPLGAIALVITAILNARLSHTRLDSATVRSILMCVLGVGAFVTIAAFTAEARAITEVQLRTVLFILLGVLILWGLLFFLFRKRARPMFYVVAAGTLFAFVATLAKVVMGRIQTLIAADWRFSAADWLTLLCILGLIVAALLGMYFVQSAHANGPPDLVVAGLTVIDPLVAVAIGIIVLGEAANAPTWAGVAFAVTGGVAVFGVYLLAKHHPQMNLDTESLPLRRGSKGSPRA